MKVKAQLGHLREVTGVSNMEHHWTLLGAIVARMCCEPGSNELPFEAIFPVQTHDKVLVFVVHNGKPAVLEDEPELFPSDSLVTQLRVLMG